MGDGLSVEYPEQATRGKFTAVFPSPMSRSDWGIFGSIIGCLAVAALALWSIQSGPNDNDGYSAEAQNTPAYQITDQSNGIPPLIRTLSADNPNPKCQPHKYQSNDDLCAQWKAADAAKSAADAAWVLGILGLLIGGATLIAAFMAARYAKEAAEHTLTGANEAKRSADAGERAIEEAQRIGEAQTRCYISGVKACLSVLDKVSSVTITVRNTGQSPARKVTTACRIYINQIDGEFRKIEQKDVGHTSILDVATGETELPLVQFAETVNAQDRQLAKSGNKVYIQIEADIRFEDVFGKKWNEKELFHVMLADDNWNAVIVHPQRASRTEINDMAKMQNN